LRVYTARWRQCEKKTSKIDRANYRSRDLELGNENVNESTWKFDRCLTESYLIAATTDADDSFSIDIYLVAYMSFSRTGQCNN
jgi:hypothetical protein